MRAKTNNNLARLFWKTNKLEEAEHGLLRNKNKLEDLVNSEPQKYEPILAVTYNYLGILANKRNKLDEAIDYHLKVLEIRERLARKSSFYKYRPVTELTGTYNNLACVYKKYGNYQEAAKYYKEAVVIRRRYKNKNQSAFRQSLALSYSNYATALNLIGDNDKAQEFCEEAYIIRRELAQETSSYEVELANTLHEYGIILTNADESMYPKAKEYFEDAIRIRENLFEKDEMTYKLKLAETYSYYGKLLVKMGEDSFDKQYYRWAEEKMRKACEICDKFPPKNEGYNGYEISEIYQSFANLLDKNLKRYHEAESYYEKAIKGWKKITKQCPNAFATKLKKAKDELEKLQEKIN